MPLAFQPPQQRDSVIKKGANYLVGKLGQAAVFTAGKLVEGTFSLIFGKDDAVQLPEPRKGSEEEPVQEISEKEMQ